MHIKSLQMKRALRSVLLVLLLCAAGMGKMDAQSFTVDNLRYTVNSDGVSVTVNGLAQGVSASGSLVIPEIVTYNGSSYLVTTIGNYAFANCSGFTGNLTIGNSVTRIGSEAFRNCNGFTGSLTIPNSVASIGIYAFSNCSGFTGNLTIGNSVATIGGSAFYGCNGFTEIYYTGDLAQWCDITFGGIYANPLAYAHNLYINNSLVTQLVIPENMTELKNYTFHGCTSLIGSLTIPNSVTSIGQYAFEGCSGFTGSLTIPNSVTSIGGWTFCNCSGFTGDLTIPNSVTTISQSAFANCSGFTGSLVIGNSVTSISQYAFSGCSGFTEVHYNATNCADANSNYPPFSDFSGTLIIGDNVEKIPAYMFKNAGFSGNLTIPNSVTSIGNGAFYNCNGFTGSLIIPNSVTEIGNNAFRDCNGFTGNLTIGSSVTSIGNYAFSGCTGFSSISSLAETPPTLSNNAFYNINKSNPVYIPCGFEETYSSLSWGGFSNFYGMCAGTVTVTADPEESGTVAGGGSFEAGQTCTVTGIPNEDFLFFKWTHNGAKVSTNAEYTFYVAGDMTLVAHFLPDNNIDFADVNVKNICIAHWDTDGDGELSYMEAAEVTDLGNCFKNNTEITSFEELQYFSGLSTIGNNAFSNCSGLTSVILPNSVTTIGYSAFQNCSGFTGSLDIPNSVTTIGDYAFSGCSSFTGSLNIGNSVTSIGYCAFQNCSGFTGSLIIPNSVTTISQSAFANCSGFTGSLVIGNSVTSIGYQTFYNCSGFTGSLIIPNSVTDISGEAFANCSGFTGSLVIGNSVTSIGYQSFYNCSGFTEVYYTGNLAQWSDITFRDRYSNPLCYAHNLYIDNSLVTQLVIPETVTEIKSFAFYGCTSLTGSLFIPNSVTSIGGSSFFDCYGLTGTLTIPNSVTSIGYNAFAGCSGFIGTLTIGNSVTSISERAFAECNGFSSITSLAETPPSLGNNAFYPFSSLSPEAPVYVPCGFDEAYASMSWGGFDNFVGLCGGTVTVSADPEEFGTVIGGGTFNAGQTCTVTASANESYAFTHWTLNGVMVSNNAEYNFYVAGDMALVAHFASVDNIFFADANVKSICVSHWDTNGDGELSYAEAATVANLRNYFSYNTEITSFEELQYFIGLSSIGNSAFYDCSSLTSIMLPNSLTTISAYAFNNCSGLTGDLTIPNSVTEIGWRAFYNCSGFTGNLIIPNSVILIDNGAFEGCNGFTGNLTIGNSVTTIGSGAFKNCSGFTGDLIIPNSVTTIGGGNVSGAFYNCIGFTGNLIIGNSVTSIGEAAFYNCSGFTGSLIIPNSVTEIGSDAFRDCNGFTGNLTIGNSVTTIGGSAFWGCSCFTGSLIIPDSVIEIGQSAFNGCNGFTGNLTISNSMTTISKWTFDGCSGFTGNLIIPNSVTTIGDYAFYNCSGFTGNLTIPNSVTTIGNSAFYNCSGFEQIIVDYGNMVYDSRDNCNAIIKSSSNELIMGCKNTIIPDSVISIGNYAFTNCTGLTSMIIPNSVISIGDYAFASCTGLTSMIIPNSVTSIGNYAFQNCSGITGNLIIPHSVTIIRNGTFSGCSGLTSLTIGNSVTLIGAYAFSSCNGLTEVMIFKTIPPTLYNNAFDNTNSPIYVPYESLNDYKIAPYWWSNYESRIFPMAYTTIPGYGEGEGNYRFIASPLVENTDPTTVDNMITETPYDLYRFDQSEDAEWQNYKFPENTPNFFLTNGQGYLYANAEDVNIIFKGEFNEDDTKTVALVYDTNADFAGWNLVGNPFPVSAYANRSYYTMNEDGTAVEPNMVSSGTPIPACTGIMVMAEAEGETVVFNTEAPEAAPDKGCLQIALSQVVEPVETPVYYGDGPSTGSGTFAIDKAIVSFNANDKLEKFVFNKDNARISIPQGGKELAIACTDKQSEVPLNFKAAKNGQYTINVNPEAVELDYLHLIDNLTGADVDLLAAGPSTGSGAYTFTAKTTDYASRFRLVFSANDTDGPSTGSGTFAFINNGNIIINDEGALQIVDVMGRIIVSEDVSGNVSTANMIPGVYVLHLINGNDVKTQKIVIE